MRQERHDSDAIDRSLRELETALRARFTARAYKLMAANIVAVLREARKESLLPAETADTPP